MSTLDNAVYVDWKSESADILFAFREKYSDELPCVLRSNYDELAENYAAEQPESFLDALGQEVTCDGCFLYDADSDSDSYALFMVTADKEEELKAALKKDKVKCKQRKQARKKVGMPAKRIDLGKCLPCEKVSLKPGYKIDHVIDCQNGKLILEYRNFKEHRFCSAVYDINKWPPIQSEDIERIIDRFVVREDGLTVATTRKNTVNENGYLKDKNVQVLVGRDIDKLEEWDCVYEQENLKWTQMIWFQGELFAADQNCVYQISDVMNFTNTCKKVMELKAGHHSWFPKFFVLNNELYLFMHCVIYKWEKKRGFLKKRYEFTPIYKINGHNAWEFEPFGKNKVAFQTHELYSKRGETKSELTVLDTSTLEVKTYPCHRGYVQKWKDDKICVLPINPTSKMPIIECFDFSTGEKRSLMYGALGADNVHSIFETEAGTILEGNCGYIYLTTQLWDFMKTER